MAAASRSSLRPCANFTDLRAARAQALYTQDANMPLRKSHENPLIKKAYEEFLVSRRTQST